MTSQLALGHRAILKGFLSQAWRCTLSKRLSRYSTISETMSLDILSGLLKIVWKEQLAFWDLHLQHLHQELASCSSTIASSRHTMYQHRIRQLYSQRHQCLQGHQDQYFPPDVESFLSQSTTTQLKQYLHHYESPILQSIKSAQRINLRPITSFPGFIRRQTQKFSL